MKSKFCVIIPAYNVENTIVRVIEGVRETGCIHAIVMVDDGSFDATARLAQAAHAIVIKNRSNQGKGYALKAGFRYAIENGYEAVICLDGDMQHSPGDIRAFVNCYLTKNPDMIIGSRMGDLSTMPWDRRFSNQTTSLIISILTGVRIRDSQSGYRLIKTRALQRISLTSNRYETESELLIKVLMRKYKIMQLPIKTIYNDQPSHIHRLTDTLRFLQIIFFSLIKKH